MNWIKSFFSKVAGWVRSGKAKADVDVVFAHVSKVLPIVKVAVDIVTGLTPTKADDVAWNIVRAKYPALFDGHERTGEEIKLAALAYATEAALAKYPALSTNTARLAIEAAVLKIKSEDEA